MKMTHINSQEDLSRFTAHHKQADIFFVHSDKIYIYGTLNKMHKGEIKL